MIARLRRERCSPSWGKKTALPSKAATALQPQVFLVRNIGFITPTAARRIGYEDSLAFEAVHEETYRAFGFELVEVASAPLAARADFVTGFAQDQAAASDSRR